jgi:uncharacterized protein (UPF0333 family)
MPINPLLIKIGILIASLIGAFFIGYRSASIVVHGQWDKEKAQNNAKTAQIINEANNRVFMAEHAANDRIANISAIYEKKLKEQKNAKSNLDNLNATSGMFINAILPSYCNASNNAPTTASLGDGATRVRLSQADGRFLIAIADEADQIANQLSQCQAVIQSDRFNNDK